MCQTKKYNSFHRNINLKRIAKSPHLIPSIGQDGIPSSVRCHHLYVSSSLSSTSAQPPLWQVIHPSVDSEYKQWQAFCIFVIWSYLLRHLVIFGFLDFFDLFYSFSFSSLPSISVSYSFVIPLTLFYMEKCWNINWNKIYLFNVWYCYLYLDCQLAITTNIYVI